MPPRSCLVQFAEEHIGRSRPPYPATPATSTKPVSTKASAHKTSTPCQRISPSRRTRRIFQAPESGAAVTPDKDGRRGGSVERYGLFQRLVWACLHCKRRSQRVVRACGATGQLYQAGVVSALSSRCHLIDAAIVAGRAGRANSIPTPR